MILDVERDAVEEELPVKTTGSNAAQRGSRCQGPKASSEQRRGEEVDVRVLDFGMRGDVRRHLLDTVYLTDNLAFIVLQVLESVPFYLGETFRLLVQARNSKQFKNSDHKLANEWWQCNIMHSCRKFIPREP